MTTESPSHTTDTPGATSTAADLTHDGITHTTVGGIPTLLAPGSGPVTAGLLFRVGRADETLATSGITHLVEHLALHRHGMGDLHYNGATATLHTHFHVTGSPADVIEYLNGVCAALRDLPLDRLETEKDILRTEAAGRTNGPAHGMAPWRYGARGYGLTGFGEAGLRRLTAANVRDWARTRFTAENAVLWMTTDTVPEGLDLTLPTGTWHPAPEPTSALPTTPAHFVGGDGGMVLTSVIPRSAAGVLFTEVLGKQLFRDLRQKGGYSYTAAADYQPRDADHATVTAYADALPQQQDAMVGAFVDVLAALRAGRVEQADLDSVRAAALARADVPEPAVAALPSRALNLLLRRPTSTFAEARAELEAVTVADIGRVAREVWAGALIDVPTRGLEWAGTTAAPTRSEDVVTGPRWSARDDPRNAVIVGRDGISLVGPDTRITVRYADCVLLYAFPDGGRHLVGADGFTLTVEPTLFGITAAELAHLDAGVPPASVVRMPARTPDRIPQPSTPKPAGPAPRKAWLTAVMWLLGVPGLLIGASSAIVTLALISDGTGDSTDWTVLACIWIVAAVFLIPWGVCLRRRRNGLG
ncbi:M16 family metallopeptidase [Streptomyces sp. NPDC058623]|uniref:M16 family metallopeptidase n=1 Tax=Streptomyces sp. NPDC058623 TaxID=3346563 RepID=UPI003647F15D